MMLLDILVPGLKPAWLHTLLDASLITLLALLFIRLLTIPSPEKQLTPSLQLWTGVIVFGAESILMLLFEPVTEHWNVFLRGAADAALLALIVAAALSTMIVKVTAKQPSLEVKNSASSGKLLFWTSFYAHVAAQMVLITIGLIQLNEARQYFEDMTFAEEQRKLETIELVFLAELRQLTNATLLLSEQGELKEYATNPEHVAKLLDVDYRTQLKMKSELYQLSYVASDGWEKVRIERHADKVVAIEKSELRYQGGQEFMNTARQKAGIHITRAPVFKALQLGLPEERQLIHLFVAVYDYQGSYQGVVSTYFILPGMLNLLDNNRLDMHRDTRFNNHLGWVMLGNAQVHFQNEIGAYYPKNWKEMEVVHVGTFRTNDTLVVFHKIEPNWEMGDAEYLASTGYWWLTSSIDNEALSSRFGRQLWPYVLLFILAATLVSTMIHLFLNATSRRKWKRQQLERHAYTDFLTGLPNRLRFREFLAIEQERSLRMQNQSVLIYLDLDDFKRANDELGHDAGDQILKTVARRLHESIRPYDLAARLGGDEFAIILNFPITQDEAVAIAQRIIDTIRKTIDYQGASCTVGSSLGITMFGHSGEEDIDEIIFRGDQAMYAAKRAGKNQYHYSDRRCTASEHPSCGPE